MTETIIDLPGVIAMNNDAGFRRDLIEDAAQRLKDIEVAAVRGDGHDERGWGRDSQRSGYCRCQWDSWADPNRPNMPKLRNGSSIRLPELRRTAERALMAVRQKPKSTAFPRGLTAS